MGNLTDVHFKPIGEGAGRHAVGTFKGASSYTTGGDAFNIKDCGLASLYGATPAIGFNSSNTALYTAVLWFTDRGSAGEGWGVRSGKVVITQLSDGAEVANATDLSAIIFTGMVVHGA